MGRVWGICGIMWDIQATKEVREMRAMKDMRHRRDVWEVCGGHEGHK